MSPSLAANKKSKLEISYTELILISSTLVVLVVPVKRPYAAFYATFIHLKFFDLATRKFTRVKFAIQDKLIIYVCEYYSDGVVEVAYVLLWILAVDMICMLSCGAAEIPVKTCHGIQGTHEYQVLLSLKLPSVVTLLRRLGGSRAASRRLRSSESAGPLTAYPTR